MTCKSSKSAGAAWRAFAADSQAVVQGVARSSSTAKRRLSRRAAQIAAAVRTAFSPSRMSSSMSSRRQWDVGSGPNKRSSPITCLPCSAGRFAYLTFSGASLRSSQSVQRGLSLYGSKNLALSSFHFSGEKEKPCLRPSSALQKR